MADVSTIGIGTDDIRYRLEEGLANLWPSELGLEVEVPEERHDDLVEVICDMAAKKPYAWDDMGYANEFDMWFNDSEYYSRIEDLIYAAIDEWTANVINKAAEKVMEA